ncbi:MAG: LysM peptidoglycan-binding domain-containing protein [Fibrobacterota bacterium]
MYAITRSAANVLLFVLILLTVGAGAQTYTVRPTDNLWNLSRKYLGSGWEWKRIWEVNPSVYNPHLIYPGDMLRIPGYSQTGAADQDQQVWLQDSAFEKSVKGLFQSGESSAEDTSAGAAVTAEQSQVSSQSRQALAFLQRPGFRKTLPFLHWTTSRDDLPGVAALDLERNMVNARYKKLPLSDQEEPLDSGEYLVVALSERIDVGDRECRVVTPTARGTVSASAEDGQYIRIGEVWDVIPAGARLVPDSFDGEGVPPVDAAAYQTADPRTADLIHRPAENLSIHPFELFIVDKGSSAGVSTGDIFRLAQDSSRVDAHGVRALAVRTRSDYSVLMVINTRDVFSGTDYFFRRFATFSVQ